MTNTKTINRSTKFVGFANTNLVSLKASEMNRLFQKGDKSNFTDFGIEWLEKGIYPDITLIPFSNNILKMNLDS